MTGLSVVNSASKLWSVSPCGCSSCGCRVIKSTTLTTRILRSGTWWRRQIDRSQGFERRHVAGAGHHHIGLRAAVVAGPFPDADPSIAMLDRGIDVEPLRRGLLAGDDHVDPVPAPQAVVGDPEQGIGVRRQIDPNDVGLFAD